MPKWVTLSVKGGGMGAGSGKFVKSVCLEMHSLQLFPHKDNIIKRNLVQKVHARLVRHYNVLLDTRVSTYFPRSKLFLALSNFFSPESPSSPNMVITTLASVPAPLLSPVYV